MDCDARSERDVADMFLVVSLGQERVVVTPL